MFDQLKKNLPSLLALHALEISLGGLLTGLSIVAYIFCDYLYSEILINIPAPIKYMAVLILSIILIVLITYIKILKKKLKVEYILRFDVLWDENYSPVCKKCKSHIVQIFEYMGMVNPSLSCHNCGEEYFPQKNGKPVKFIEALEIVREEDENNIKVIVNRDEIK